VVALPDPPVATTPVNAGIEKYAASHAAGDDVDIVASLVSVTVSVAFVATVRALVSVCTLPEVAVE
jgi:hypothetical protein